VKNKDIYLSDILSAIESIEGFVKGMDAEKFAKDDKTSSAVIRKFEIIGEAVKKVDQSLRDNTTDIPWKEMAGMRDKLIHFYSGVDYNLVWQTIKIRLPQVKESIKKLLSK
jgi:uncharacterized protein with HEPN domain